MDAEQNGQNVLVTVAGMYEYINDNLNFSVQ